MSRLLLRMQRARLTFRLSPLLAAASATVVLAAGCGGTSAGGTSTPTAAKTPASSKPAPTREASRGGCQPVPLTAVKRILAHVVLVGAKLAKPRAVAAAATPGYFYVSTNVSGGGLRKPRLATWVLRGLDGTGPIYSVDSMAALISSYGAATLKSSGLALAAPSAYASRVCVYGPGAPHGVPAPLGGGHNGAPS